MKIPQLPEERFGPRVQVVCQYLPRLTPAVVAIVLTLGDDTKLYDDAKSLDYLAKALECDSTVFYRELRGAIQAGLIGTRANEEDDAVDYYLTEAGGLAYQFFTEFGKDAY